MGKKDLRPATLQDFFWWINERHRIYLKRKDGLPPPWTDDPILQTFKFTNAFRELDRGTLALRRMIPADAPEELVVFNTMWYRMLNWHEHAVSPGFIDDFAVLPATLFAKEEAGQKIFTAAHMTVGRAGESKLATNVRSFEQIWEHRYEITKNIRKAGTIEGAFNEVRRFYGIGSFIGYEIACDLRFSLLFDPPDALEWANIGPGCKRGLLRLGLPVSLESLRALWKMAEEHLEPHVAPHHPGWGEAGKARCYKLPPFELREIEHSLCEFDKYQRAVHGTGRPKEYYR